jgi:carboxyl-terminal processing protease
MLNKKNLPVVLLISAFGIIVALKTFAFNGNPPSKYEMILKNLSELLEEIHYSPKNIDDKFSAEVFNKYLAAVDVEKRAFLQSDIQELSRYKPHLDDEILGKIPVQFVPAVLVVAKKRLSELQTMTHEILAQPFDFTKQETVNLDYNNLDFPASVAAQREELRKKIKYNTLEKYAELLDQQESSKGKPGYVAKTSQQLEKEAREKVLKIADRYFEHLRLKANEDDMFNLFVETIVQCMDPHRIIFHRLKKEDLTRK